MSFLDYLKGITAIIGILFACSIFVNVGMWLFSLNMLLSMFVSIVIIAGIFSIAIELAIRSWEAK